jgi:hypothetical protein
MMEMNPPENAKNDTARVVVNNYLIVHEFTMRRGKRGGSAKAKNQDIKQVP